MISPPKARCGTTSIAGDARGCGNGFTTRCDGKCGNRSARSPSPAPAVSTVRPSRRLGPAARGVTTRGKKINGIKRHILVDTLGLVLAVVVHRPSIQDRDGAKLVFAKAKVKGPWVRMGRGWADGGYAGEFIAWGFGLCGWGLEIVKREDDVKGFKLLAQRLGGE